MTLITQKFSINHFPCCLEDNVSFAVLVGQSEHLGSCLISTTVTDSLLHDQNQSYVLNALM